MSTRLIDRQLSLLEYLTSGAAIFGGSYVNTNDTWPEIDPGLLDREARFSFDKRTGKIRTVLPLTVAIMEDHRTTIWQEFAEACPPKDNSQFVNAQQLCDFLHARAQRSLLTPPYLADVAACELALAQVSRVETPTLIAATYRRCDAIRRHPDAVFVSCAYDVRPVFEATGRASHPIERNTSVAVSIPPGCKTPQLFEINAALFDVLASCDTWADPSVFGATEEREDLIRDLVNSGLIEIR